MGSEGRCPREMPVSFRGARARAGRHVPGAAGLPGAWHPESDRLRRGTPTNAADLASGLAGGSREPAAGPVRAAPQAQSQERESASCWFMLRVSGGVSIAQIKSLSL